jgi:hypothetical protein
MVMILIVISQRRGDGWSNDQDNDLVIIWMMQSLKHRMENFWSPEAWEKSGMTNFHNVSIYSKLAQGNG